MGVQPATTSSRAATSHVAIVTPSVADRLVSGEKTIETRFSRTSRAPYGLVQPGDWIYFKVSGAQIVARARARRVRNLSELNHRLITTLKRKYGKPIAADEGYWEAKQTARYGVLIWLGRVSRVIEPPEVPRQYGSGWICLSDLQPSSVR